mmetsp:Transcript_56761/g.122677  ORF Transcript_56761/g.122677 Transcript_56761/m.122677 type:complete len:394 (+) Transcript_56761:41-1222(+)|eukprot:CAMPEP_0170582182 /NCGR_PEP_ID=MMETSP0224-20130122/7442_1 /TAXON_ID=285029 /ORGANISM="Togula jolla, Strain CCCM 725" /LENGTH=393 /DNA_ID=CAMNT_0010905379 /DNA_START=41 /DNA_END=1222 /DNA_ORIENTATION=+
MASLGIRNQTCGDDISAILKGEAQSALHEHFGTRVEPSKSMGSKSSISTRCESQDQIPDCSSICDSEASSSAEFAEPGQSLIFLDWDDTLFPTLALKERAGLSGSVTRDGLRTEVDEEALRRDAELEDDLKQWQEALKFFLLTALDLSDRVVILTSSRSPWVKACITSFAPELTSLFSEAGGLRVAYAGEVRKARAAAARAARQRHSIGTQCRMCLQGLWKLIESMMGPEPEITDDDSQKLTEDKFAAMSSESESFYSQCTDQTLKNILSLGDMIYERDAALKLKEKTPASDSLKMKAFLLPGGSSLRELSLRLRCLGLVLPLLVQHDGHINLDLHTCKEPLKAMAEALTMPQLGSIDSLGCAWGRGDMQDKHVTDDALRKLSEMVHSATFQT